MGKEKIAEFKCLQGEKRLDNPEYRRSFCNISWIEQWLFKRGKVCWV
jgi:hypothetical protein